MFRLLLVIAAIERRRFTCKACWRLVCLKSARRTTARRSLSSVCEMDRA